MVRNTSDGMCVVREGRDDMHEEEMREHDPGRSRHDLGHPRHDLGHPRNDSAQPRNDPGHPLRGLSEMAREAEERADGDARRARMQGTRHGIIIFSNDLRHVWMKRRKVSIEMEELISSIHSHRTREKVMSLIEALDPIDAMICSSSSRFTEAAVSIVGLSQSERVVMDMHDVMASLGMRTGIISGGRMGKRALARFIPSPHPSTDVSLAAPTDEVVEAHSDRAEPSHHIWDIATTHLAGEGRKGEGRDGEDGSCPRGASSLSQRVVEWPHDEIGSSLMRSVEEVYRLREDAVFSVRTRWGGPLSVRARDPVSGDLLVYRLAVTTHSTGSINVIPVSDIGSLSPAHTARAVREGVMKCQSAERDIERMRHSEAPRGDLLLPSLHGESP
jgi:hypothetical protein